MNIDWKDIQDIIEDSIYSCIEIEDIATELLVEKLDFTPEDAEEIMNNIYEQVNDAEDQYKLDLAIELCGYIHECVRIRDEKLHPEDAPWQLHLFDE